ncbi:unnamed protein product [Spirodela intermedia]|uniref:Uncharacterized protein n=2 Tax=Spirodela intermedia TaxID=51605 RepID=A0A7I8K854_SPIIN|nr:unnamed protein product [Spirodela intermedia]CAA6657317.1 unnamed protein product [Spirodela intermedia]CAA7393365.1 unnamed protein product [Spirodela intermedia]
MALAEKLRDALREFIFYSLILAAAAALALILLRFGPRLLAVFSFLWPLLLSTAVFLAAVLVFRVLSPPHSENQSNQTGEDFLHFVTDHTPEGGSLAGPSVSGEDAETAQAVGEQETKKLL